MSLPLSFYAIAGLAVFLTGLSKSGFGGGLGVMAVPLLSLFVAPQFAAAVLMPILLAMDVLIVWHYRNHWSRRIVLLMLPGALVGLAIGGATFQWMNADAVRLIVGVLALVLVALYLIGSRQEAEQRDTGQKTVFALGAISGFASFIAHAGGPPVKGFLLRQNLHKTDFVGTNTVFFFALNAIKTVAYAGMGQLTNDTLLISLTISPVLFIGIYVGTKLHAFVDQKMFVSIVYAGLALTGTKLLWDGLVA